MDLQATAAVRSGFEKPDFSFKMIVGPLPPPTDAIQYTSFSRVKAEPNGNLASAESYHATYANPTVVNWSTASWKTSNLFLSFTLHDDDPIEFCLPKENLHHTNEESLDEDEEDQIWKAEHSVVYIEGNPSDVLKCLQFKDGNEMIAGSSIDQFPFRVDFLGEGEGMKRESELRTRVPVTISDLSVKDLLRLVTQSSDLENTGLTAVIRIGLRGNSNVIEYQTVESLIGARLHHIEFDHEGSAEQGPSGLFEPIDLVKMDNGEYHGHHVLTSNFPLHLTPMLNQV